MSDTPHLPPPRCRTLQAFRQPIAIQQLASPWLVLCVGVCLVRPAAAQPPADNPASTPARVIADENAESVVAAEQPNALPDAPPLDEAAFQQALEQLASPSAQTRQAATDRLLGVDNVQLTELRRRLPTTVDPEARARIGLVISRIESTRIPVRRTQFLRQPDAVDQHLFYGWPAFRDIIGDTRKTRMIFLDLAAQYPLLADQAFEQPEEIRKMAEQTFGMVDSRMSDMQNITTIDAVAAQYAGLRLFEIDPDAINTIREARTLRMVSMFPYSQELIQTNSQALRQLTNAWLATVRFERFRGLLVSLDFDLDSGRTLALRSLAELPRIPNEEFGHAMLTLARFGEDEDLAVIEPLIADDDRLIIENVPQPDGTLKQVVQRRGDLALFAAISIRNALPQEYFPRFQPHPTRLALPNTLSFVEEGGPSAEREAARERYRQQYQLPAADPAVTPESNPSESGAEDAATDLR